MLLVSNTKGRGFVEVEERAQRFIIGNGCRPEDCKERCRISSDIFEHLCRISTLILCLAMATDLREAES
jgi:hypothetical protein